MKGRRLTAVFLSIMLVLSTVSTVFAREFTAGEGNRKAYAEVSAFTDDTGSLAQESAPSERTGTESTFSDGLSDGDGEEDGGDSEIVSEEVLETADMVQLLLMSPVSTNVTVTLDKGAGTTETISITTGALNAETLGSLLEGYDFVSAWFGDIEITGLYQDANGTYYATVEGNEVTGMVVENLLDIKLVYETHVATYNVTYIVNVGDSAVSDYSSMVSIVGAQTAKSNRNYEFSVTAQDGYTVNSVTVGSIILTGSDGKYNAGILTSDTMIIVELTETTSYTFSFAGSNTTLVFDGTTWNSSYSNNAADIYSETYTAAASLSFTLKGREQWSNKDKILNQLSITIDGAAVAAGIPDELNGTVTTTIAKGYLVAVTKTSNGQYPEYSVVITNPSGGKVRGIIHIQTNFKDVESSEVWAKQLDGVYPLAYGYSSDRNGWWKPTYITSDDQGDQNSRLQPEIYTYYSRKTDRDSRYYIKLTGRYNAEDLYLTVYNYSVDSSGNSVQKGMIISETKVSELRDIGNTSVSGYAATDKFFTIPKDKSSNKYVDIRIYIVYKPNLEASYSVYYDADNGADPVLENENVRVDNDIVISETIPVKDGYVFEGWTLGDDSTLYQGGDLFNVTDDVLKYADGDRKITFKAKWISASEAVYAPYKFNVYLENDNGTYEGSPVYSANEKGRINNRAYIISDKLDDVIAASVDLTIYEFDHQDTDKVIAADGSTVLNIYYCLKKFYVYHTGVEGGNVQTYLYKNYVKGETFDLAATVTSGTLYGGYYSEYNPTKEGAAYTGSNATWDSTKAYKECGKAIHPAAGQTYYIKEVPATYLKPTQIETYHRFDLHLRNLILTSAVDDDNYGEVGFAYGTTTYNAGSIFNTLTIDFKEDGNSDSDTTITAATVAGVDGLNGKIATFDLFNIYAGNEYSSIIGTKSIKAYWTTLDGVTVTGGKLRRLIIKDVDSDGILQVDGKEITYKDFITVIKNFLK